MRRTALLVAAIAALGCATSTRRFPLKEPMWRDPDDVPFAEQPAEYWSPLAWDGIDKTIFRPVSRFFAVDPGGEAVNVNALDEVPDSSWFERRAGFVKLERDDFFHGPCKGRKPLSADEPWTVVRAKPDGANPGFMIKTEDGRKFLVKFETDQIERASSADVIGTRLYWAAGFYTPCNVVVFMRPEILRIDKEAKVGEGDKKVPLQQKHLDVIFKNAAKLGDGRYRANASLLLEGKPLGPWRYHGTREDDPNDVVPHEDRRELRASRVLGSWLNHHDAREQNTLATWIEKDGRGFVRHNVIDWGDCLGGLWEWDALSRRIGHAYYLDFEDVLVDFVTLGIPRRKWDLVHFGPAGDVLGYFDSEHFDAEDWHVGYPNPAFSRMTERDAAWMARIVARFDDEAVDAMVDAAQIQAKNVDTELRRVLKGRRDKILARWLSRLSPLTAPNVSGDPPRLCLDDVAVLGKVAQAKDRRYLVRAFVGDALEEVSVPTPTTPAVARICTALPKVPGASKATPKYLVVDVTGVSPGLDRGAPSRVHLYDLGGEYRVVGLERPDDATPPRP